MKEPTQEQIKELWEWCGGVWWSIHPQEDYHGGDYEQLLGKEVLLPDGEGDMPHIIMPDGYAAPNKIDPNNLFKYAVPKARGIIGADELAKRMKGWISDVIQCGVDPSNSLFWLLRRVLHGH